MLQGVAKGIAAAFLLLNKWTKNSYAMNFTFDFYINVLNTSNK